MGADFCFSWIGIKKEDEPTLKEKLYKAIDNFKIPELSSDNKQKILNNLQDTKSNHFQEFNYFWEECLYNEVNDEGYPVGEDGNVITLGEARDKMKEVVDEVIDNLYLRDMGTIEFKGYKLFISGGMSWGDEPTQSYKSLNDFNLLPQDILKEAGIE